MITTFINSWAHYMLIRRHIFSDVSYSNEYGDVNSGAKQNKSVFPSLNLTPGKLDSCRDH